MQLQSELSQLIYKSFEIYLKNIEINLLIFFYKFIIFINIFLNNYYFFFYNFFINLFIFL